MGGSTNDRVDRRGARSAAGFTLIEVVLAIGVLAVGASLVLAMLSFGAALSSSAVTRADAAAAIPRVVADLQDQLFPLLEDGTVGEPTGFEGRPVPGFEGLRYDAVPGLLGEPSDGVGLVSELYHIRGEIYWTSRGRRQAVPFETVLPREIPFGERLRRTFVENERIRRPLGGDGP